VGVLHGAFGFLVGACVSLFALIGIAFSGTQRGLSEHAVSPIIGVVIGLGAIVVCPIFYGAMGFVFALIGAWFYNLVASKVGGIEIDVA
jgi:hypothetical protein